MEYRTRKIISSKMRRVIRWEFWPMPVFYLPIVIYIIFLSLKYRGLSFLAVNPGMPMSGLIGERKGDMLSQLEGSEFLARFNRINSEISVIEKIKLANQFMQDHSLTFPVVLKPDFGQRGQDVEVIRDQESMRSYFDTASGVTLIQEHVEGEEFGVFYMSFPATNKTKIFSITEKTFPVLIGDGVSSIEILLLENDRTHFMAEYLLDLHASRLNHVLELDEEFKVVEIGSHCRGSVFYDANKLISEQLLESITSISHRITGFHFGRYDIRAKDSQALMGGRDFKVLEVNGVTSESTNVYDPKNSVITAYKILFSQWRSAFEIGRQNINKGADRVSIGALISHLKHIYGFPFSNNKVATKN